MDKTVTSIHQIDISDLRFPIIAAYEHPDDYPDKCVARIFDLDRTTDTAILKDSMEELHEDIRSRFPAVFFKATKYDLPSIRGAGYCESGRIIIPKNTCKEEKEKTW